MQLGQFITENMEAILLEWQAYAKSLPPGKHMAKVALRDHAKAMLLSIVKDLSTAQSTQQTIKKSKQHANAGQVDAVHANAKPIENTAAKHALDRFEAGFTIQDLVSEFRALRASVLRLWGTHPTTAEPLHLHDMTHFNECVDEALAESVDVYAKQKERNIRLYETILLSSPDHNYILDLNAHFLYANPAMAEQCNQSVQQMIGKSLLELCLLEVLEVEQAVKKVILEQAAVRGEICYSAHYADAQATHPTLGARLGTRLGTSRLYEFILTPILDDNGVVEAIAGTERDITERKTAEEAIWHRANYDYLTELPNRNLFRDRLEQQVMLSVRTGKLAALFFIDLDHFKVANDTLGHDAGDELLKQAAIRIRACMRQNDTVARIGGDEFTVILTDFDAIGHVKKIANKVLKALAKPFLIFGKKVTISASIGISLVPQDANNAEKLISRADQAMYNAKNAGRNHVKFFN